MLNEEQFTSFLIAIVVSDSTSGLEHENILESHWETLKTLSNAQLVRIVSGVASGLEFLHSSSIIHGQLKGKNIVLDENLIPKIRNISNNKIKKNFEDARWWALEIFDHVSIPNYN